MLAHAVLSFLADVPDFGGGQAPPGSDKLLTVGRWVLWIVTALCVVGILIVGGRMVIEHNHGQGGQHGHRLGMAVGGCIVVGAASGIAAALI